jgi:hypothetical protein
MNYIAISKSRMVAALFNIELTSSSLTD